MPATRTTVYDGNLDGNLMALASCRLSSLAEMLDSEPMAPLRPFIRISHRLMRGVGVVGINARPFTYNTLDKSGFNLRGKVNRTYTEYLLDTSIGSPYDCIL